ncbi:MAG: hypothetical protein V1895_04105 [Parcubacteria group bacterium]
MCIDSVRTTTDFVQSYLALREQQLHTSPNSRDTIDLGLQMIKLVSSASDVELQALAEHLGYPVRYWQIERILAQSRRGRQPLLDRLTGYTLTKKGVRKVLMDSVFPTTNSDPIDLAKLLKEQRQ